MNTLSVLLGWYFIASNIYGGIIEVGPFTAGVACIEVREEVKRKVSAVSKCYQR